MYFQYILVVVSPDLVETELSKSEQFTTVLVLHSPSSVVQEVTCSVPPTEAPLLDFNGTARERFGKGNYDASGTFSTFSGAAESTVINSKSQVLFDVNGTALEKHTENYVGKGSLFGFVSSTESTVINSAASGLFKFQGGAIEKNTENYVGSGTLFGFDSSTEATEVLSTTSGLFKFTGAATNVHVRFHQLGTGSLFGFNGGAESVTFDYNCHSSIVNIGADNYGFVTESVVDETINSYANVPISTYANEVVSDFGLDPRQESFGHISIDPEQSINTHGPNHEDYGLITEPEGGNKFPCVHIHIGGTRLTETRARGYAGSGTFSAFIGAAEVVAQTDDTFGLFKIHGSGGIVASLSHVGSGEINIGDSGIDKFVKVQFSPPTTGVLFKFSGGLDVSGVKERPSDLKATFAEVGHAKLRIAGDAFTTFHLGHIGSGQLDINGNAIEKHTEAYLGSGSLFAFTGGAESFTRDIPETATLFRFAGNGIEKNTENYVGRGALFGFVSKTESTTSAEQPKYSSISKVLLSTESYSTILVLVHSPSLVVRQKQEQLSRKQVVCSHSVATHQNLSLLHQKLVLVLYLHLLERQKERLATTLHHHYSRLVGMQSLDSLLVLLVVVDSTFFRKSPNSMLKVKTDLSVLKKEEQSTTLLPYYSASTETSKSSLSSKKLVVDSPELVEKHSPKLHLDILVVVGLLSTVILDCLLPMSHIGSGTIFGFVGGAEATAVDLPPQKGLLRFAGTSPEAFQRGPEIGTASLQIKSSPVFVIQPQSHFRWFQVHHLWKWSRIQKQTLRRFWYTVRIQWCNRISHNRPSSTDSNTLRVQWKLWRKRTNAHQGTGSLFGFDSATEVRTVSPELSGLFKVQGTGAEAKTKVFTGSGTFDLNTKRDGVDVSGKQVYISAPERTTVNPPEETQVFSFNGAAVATEDRSHKGRGSLFGFTGAAESRAVAPESTGLFKVQGSGEESRSRIYSGTGRVFGFTGGAEATAVTENVPGSLFKLTGTVRVLFERTPFIGSGSLFSFTGATETTAVAPPVATLFEFNGNGAESRTRPYQGSGTLVTFKSATIARRVPYDATQGLFKLAGALKESFVPSTYVGTTGVQFIGASADRRIEFESPKPTQIYIV